MEPASGAALPDAPSYTFYAGDQHGDCRLVELTWRAWMRVERGAFADKWISSAERAALPAHLGVIVTYVDVCGRWVPMTVATASAILPNEWGYFAARKLGGGECIGFMMDTRASHGASRYHVRMRSGTRDGAYARAGGPRCANDPHDTRLRANARFYDIGLLAVAPFSEILPLQAGLSACARRRREILWEYGKRYWAARG